MNSDDIDALRAWASKAVERVYASHLMLDQSARYFAAAGLMEAAGNLIMNVLGREDLGARIAEMAGEIYEAGYERQQQRVRSDLETGKGES